ncbi:hypothetical protein GPL17_18740 [Bradyrhizobium yuanmingense]|uniref:hypothetical protein n=1 Tax=Bradyrhizobium yuanmingense TaxID=108015 RepID=UPI0012F78288|nr:hypothetical protein [Bradyrhizobium yuanmingense]MVT52521.1 hypothetical protein [Bradyrhizobium yuanmingense]
MRFFNRDAPNNSHTARVRGKIVRIVNGLDTEGIREAYKEGQKHNSRAYDLIDACNDITVNSLAYRMAEEVRLQACDRPSPARSASCSNATENIRWSLFDGGHCSGLSRSYMEFALDESLRLYEQADFARKAVKVAQGHRREVFDSIDYIGDRLLMQMVKAILADRSISGLPRVNIDESARRYCPGLSMMESKE